MLTGDIEGAICDECGSRIGPNGCCATARKIAAQKVTSAERVAALEKDLAAANLAAQGYLRDIEEMARTVKDLSDDNEKMQKDFERFGLFYDNGELRVNFEHYHKEYHRKAVVDMREEVRVSGERLATALALIGKMVDRLNTISDTTNWENAWTSEAERFIAEIPKESK